MANDRMRAWLTRPGGLASELVTARGALSMRQLAAKLGEGWGSSRISKLEHGQQLPSAEDLDAIASGLNLDAATRAAWRALLDEANGKRASFARRRHMTTGSADNLALMLEAEAGYIRAVSPSVIPELLRTADYAAEVAAIVGSPGFDSAHKVKEITERQRILTDLEKAFQFVITEAALRTIPGRASVMAGQLDRLISASAMGNVQIGVLPQMEPISALPSAGAVTIYDVDAVVDDGFEQRHYADTEANRIIEWMDDLWSAALHGEAARRRILEVSADLAEA